MLEDIVFNSLTMPGEMIRLVIAFLGTGVTAYYDLFNNKNVPNTVLYAFLAIAFLVNLVFYSSDLFIFSILAALFMSGIGYVFYRLGQLGGADVFVIASIMLLLPIHPSFVHLPFNMPFIFSVIVFSGVAFAIYVLAYFGYKLLSVEAKPKLIYALMFIPYLLFAYVYYNSILFSAVYFAFISILLFAAIFFLMFKESLNGILAEELPIAQVQPEDVIAVEVMNKDLVDRFKIPRLVTKAELDRLKKTGKVTELWVYTKLPPFLPFMLLGMVLGLFLAKSLILI